MTSILEKAIAVIAPHACIICGNYNNVVCAECLPMLVRIPASFCVQCGAATAEWRLCHACASQNSLERVWVHSYYENTVAELIHRFKFDHARSASKPLAALIATSLPSLPGFTVVPVPTTAPHIRQRGYDHTLLLAKEAARLTGLPLVRALERTENTQQIGRTRAERKRIARSIGVRTQPPSRVLLIDDVCTTASTLQACAKKLKDAGATEVFAAVVAYKK